MRPLHHFHTGLCLLHELFVFLATVAFQHRLQLFRDAKQLKVGIVRLTILYLKKSKDG